jgi:hypothetical protein
MAKQGSHLPPRLLVHWLSILANCTPIDRKTGGIGIAIVNDCRRYKIISANNYSRAYTINKSRGMVVAKQLPQQKHRAPIEWRANWQLTT